MISRAIVFVFLLCAAISAEPPHLNRKWLNLLYYERTDTGYCSAADSPEFFVSTTGKTQPDTEYEAELTLCKAQDASFRRKFPLRYKYLAQANQLNYMPLVTPDRTVESAIIAFPNRYMGNPASMFGHLFIVLKSRHGLAGSSVVHFLADTSGSDPSAYIYNGLAGNFKGRFRIEPYYKKIRDYTDLEDREIIYYDMALSPSQLEDLQLAAIELQNTFFYYYFLDENCAYFTGKLMNVILDSDILHKSVLVFPSQVINSLRAGGYLTSESRRIQSSSLFNNQWNRLSDSDRHQVVDLFQTVTQTVPSNAGTLRAFLFMSDYMIINAPDLSQSIQHNRLLAYRELARQNHAQIHPKQAPLPTISPIASNRIGIGYGYKAITALRYDPIRYGDLEQFESSELKTVNYFGSEVSVTPVHPMQYRLDIAQISNFPQWTPIRPESSWRIESQIGYGVSTFTNHSFEMGQSHSLTPDVIGTALVGVSVGNFDPVLNEAWEPITIRPSLYGKLQYQLIPGNLVATIAIENRFDRSRAMGTLNLKTPAGIVTVEGVMSDPFQGLRIGFTVFGE